MQWLTPSVLFAYWALFSVLGAGLAAYDKIVAKALPKKRVPEKTLLAVAFVGGAEAMYLTMLLIRHKTRHKKFMVGLPVMVGVHVLLVFCYFLCR